MLTVEQVKAMGRKSRRPTHPFLIECKPYVIQPMFIAPVLPGETMKFLNFQARAVTAPIKHPLIGWWHEYYFFYVKIRDLDDRAVLETMFLDPDAGLASIASATAKANNYFYTNATKNGVDYVEKCLKRVVEEFFRDQGESYATGTLDTFPMARAFNKDANWMDSLAVDASMPEADPNDTSEQAQDPQYRMWLALRSAQFTNLSFEGWLRTFGINVPKQELHQPELIRFVRKWQYPSNTVDPATGTPSSAVSWSLQERASKNRFFTEPGFLFGVTVTRPKVYMKNQLGTLTSYLQTAMDWIPPLFWDDPSVGVKQFADGTGPIDTSDTGGYWIDIKDLFLYGEQFTNLALAADTTRNGVSLPTTGGAISFPTSTDVDNLFAGASKIIKIDGVVQLGILGKQVETT